MEKKSGKKIWLVILPLLAAAALTVGFIYFFSGRDAETRPPGDAASPSILSSHDSASANAPGTHEDKASGQDGGSLQAQGASGTQGQTFSDNSPRSPGSPPQSPSQNPSAGRPSASTTAAFAGSPTGPPPSGVTLSFLSLDAADEVYCAQVEGGVIDFFAYLDKKGYGASDKSGQDAYTRFKRILKRLGEVPPIPAGEGADPDIIIRNLYHFFRALDSNDLRLIKAVIIGEFDTMDANLELFYQWLTLEDRCPDPEGLRPTPGVLYRYAGFFLNTTGGRAYLYRRSPNLRMLINYYSLLIVNWADRAGKNYYGLDPVPLLGPLKQEIQRYPDLRLQQEYLDTLDRLQSYYAARR